MIPRLDLNGFNHSSPSKLVKLNWVLHCQAGIEHQKYGRTQQPSL